MVKLYKTVQCDRPATVNKDTASSACEQGPMSASRMMFCLDHTAAGKKDGPPCTLTRYAVQSRQTNEHALAWPAIGPIERLAGLGPNPSGKIGPSRWRQCLLPNPRHSPAAEPRFKPAESSTVGQRRHDALADVVSEACLPDRPWCCWTTESSP